MQQQDPKLKEIIEILQGKEAVNKKQIKDDYVLQRCRLHRRTQNGQRLVVPRGVTWRIVRSCHDEAGHFGVEKTLQRIAKNFWFAKMRHKYVIIRAVKNTRAATAISTLEEVIMVYGRPIRIISDRGTAFTSKNFEAMVGSHGIQHVKTAVRTPRANGQAERVNKTVLASLKCVSNNENEWDKCLPNLQWSINSLVNATTRQSPNNLVFGYDPRDVTNNKLIQAVQDEETENTTQSKEHLYEEVLQNIHQEKLKWKQRFDAAHARPKVYTEGELVAIEFVAAASGKPHKLEPAYRGPYVVSKVLSNDRYLVEDLPDTPQTSRHYSGVLTPEHMKPWCILGPENDVEDEEEPVVITE